MSGRGWDRKGAWVSFPVGLLSFLEAGAAGKRLSVTRLASLLSRDGAVTILPML